MTVRDDPIYLAALKCGGLPSSIEAERWVLGSVLLDDGILAQVARQLDASDLSVEKHRRIFRRMGELAERLVPIEDLTLVEELRKHDQLDSSGGVAYIASLTEGLPRLSSINSYIEIVKHKASLRALIHSCRRIAVQAHQPGADASRLTGELREKLETCARHSGPALTIADLALPSMAEFAGDTNWLVERFVPAGGITIVAGEPGAGKSLFALALSCAVVKGGNFLHRPVARRPVLYIDRENSPHLIKERMRMLRCFDLSVWGGWHSSPPPGPADSRLRSIARNQQPLIVFDSLVAFHPGDENSASETRKIMNDFRALASLGATVLILHHQGKSESSRDYRGSSDIAAAVDEAWSLEANKNADGRLQEVHLRSFKNRSGATMGLSASFQDGLGFVLPAGRDVQPPKRPGQFIEEFLISNGPSSTRKIEAAAVGAGFRRSEVRTLLKGGRWSSVPGQRGANIYSADGTAERFEL